ncbi:MAG: hypothetical protein OXT71_15030 [Acidobacteriota bacterium]|nr:hypothetical protein [Acidobacteriota bacterium]
MKTEMLHTPPGVLRNARTAWTLTGLLFVLFSPPGLRAQEAPEHVPDLAGMVLTVNGPVDPDSLGATMVHEHIFINRNHPNRPVPTTATRVRFYLKPLTMDMLGAVTMGYPNRDNLILGDETTALQELTDYRKRGGGTLVDVTSIGLGRDPAALRRVSRASGVHVVMGTGWDTRALDSRDLADRSLSELTREIVRDVTVGVGNSGIRSGIIGEVATGGDSLTPVATKAIRAAARASRITGAPVSLHSGGSGSESTHAMLDLLAAEGAELGRVILGHCDNLVRDLPSLLGLLKRGVYVEFDGISEFHMLRQAATAAHVGDGIVKLIQRGYLERILLSQNVDQKIDLKAYGGMGYTFVLEKFVPHLRNKGVAEEQIRTLIYENPQRILTFVARRQ